MALYYFIKKTTAGRTAEARYQMIYNYKQDNNIII